MDVEPVRVPLEKWLFDLQRAVENALGAGDRPPILDQPERLLGILMEGEERRKAGEARLGVPVPRFAILSVTWRCNLDCLGCYAKVYEPGREMDLAGIRRVLGEACDLGIFAFVIVGGEPFFVPGLVEALLEERRGFFFLFTNGTLLTERHAEALARAPPVLPVLSIEGDAERTDDRRGGGTWSRIERAAGLLRAARVPFGTACMVTHRNLDLVTSRPWFDALWDMGVRFVFLNDYIPFPENLEPSLVLTDEDRERRRAAMEERRAEARPLFLSFPPDEYLVGGCQAAGMGFLHVNADGWVEPCPFTRLAADNLKGRSLEEALGSPFFREIREAVRKWDNPGGQCLLFAHADEVRAIAARTGARPTCRT
ncbi:MAG: radical SAM protein [Planctomycetes bacterium]|jgi:MoaA/NifB/PqqE/SkfB family radical SAM enzyme|nr:radical SAM protein [Planctomycetota bacterium]